MALIDRSYFIGELNIPGSNRDEIGGVLDWFIAKYEPEILLKVLGLDLYEAFKTGLAQSTVDARWTDLLTGTDYSYGSINRRWKGIISQATAVIDAIEALNTITVIVGRGHLVTNGDQANDPVAGASSVLIPAAFVGKQLQVVQRAFGELRSDEYSIVGNVLTLNNWTFSNGDTYFYKSATLAINTTTGLNKESFIANYVYYWFMRNNVTQSTPMGEVATSNENATVNNAVHKMTRAWNEMDHWVEQMFSYLNASRTVYPEWKNFWCGHPRRINAFNI